MLGFLLSMAGEGLHIPTLILVLSPSAAELCVLPSFPTLHTLVG